MLLLNKPSSKYERLPLQETPFAEENAYEPGAKTDWTLRKLNCPATFTYSLTFVFGVLLGIISYHLQLSQHASSYESGLTIEISTSPVHPHSGTQLINTDHLQVPFTPRLTLSTFDSAGPFSTRNQAICTLIWVPTALDISASRLPSSTMHGII